MAIDLNDEITKKATDTINPVSVLFSSTVVALLVVSIGTAYLSISSFLDNRAEKKDQERSKIMYDTYEGTNKKNTKKQKKKKAKIASDKGFGPNK